MNTISLSQLASVSDLQRNYSGLIDRIKKLAVPVVLLRRNRPEAVLISIKTYEDMAEIKRLYEEMDTLRAIEEFEKDRRAGKLLVGKTGSDLFKFEKMV